MQIHWIHIIKSFGQYCLAVLLSFAFVSNEKVQLLWIKGLSTRCTQRVNLVYRHFYYIFIEMPWIHITKSFKQYCSAVSLPFAYVLLRGYNFYKKKWFSTLCTQRVNLMTICFYYFFVMLIHWIQNIESFGRFQQVVLLLFPYVFRKVCYFY